MILPDDDPDGILLVMPTEAEFDRYDEEDGMRPAAGPAPQTLDEWLEDGAPNPEPDLPEQERRGAWGGYSDGP